MKRKVISIIAITLLSLTVALCARYQKIIQEKAFQENLNWAIADDTRILLEWQQEQQAHDLVH